MLDNAFITFREIRETVLLSHEGKQTEILEAGPTITADEANGFYIILNH